jgi:NADPH:quinone reductase-like Zn-dependent oxidoreductase
MWKIVPVKAIRIHEDGGPEVLRYEDVADPVPGKGQVLIELRAASLNHLDVWIRNGLPSVPKPRILGADGAGVVVSGDGFAPGARVVIDPGVENREGRVTVLGEHTDGTHAELIAVPREQVYPLPDEISFETAAAFPLVFETAYRMLTTKAGLREGEWVLAWGIGSGVSTAVLAIAKALGARVAVTSSSPDKLARARELGADATFDHTVDDVVTGVKEVSDGGAHIVIDHVGEATWKRSLNAARPGGRVCVCGATTGANPPANLHRIWWKQLTIYGSTMGSREDFEAVYDLVRSGDVQPVVDVVFPLAEAASAHARLEAGAQLGKIVLRIPD